MKWKLIHDMQFCDGNQSEFITLSKDQIFNQVSHGRLQPESLRCLQRNKKSSPRNTRFVILNANGKQRIFEVGKDVIPVSRGVEGIFR